MTIEQTLKDHRQLARAALAAGYSVRYVTEIDVGFVDTCMHQLRPEARYFAFAESGRRWDPRADDGDALRLAVKLGVRAGFERNAPPELKLPRECSLAVDSKGRWFAEAAAADPNAATRLAIVRAAEASYTGTDEDLAQAFPALFPERTAP